MDEVECEYAYRPKWVTILLGGLLSTALTAGMAVKAAGNDRGLILWRVVEFGPGGATAFYWGVAAVGGAFVGVMAFVAWHRMTHAQRIAFGPAALAVPASRWSAAETVIPFGDIVFLSATNISGQRLLTITHLGGKFVLAAAMLPHRAAYDEVCALLANKVKAARPGTVKPHFG